MKRSIVLLGLLAMASVSAPSRPVAGGAVIDVAAFGAAGDGVTDDRPAGIDSSCHASEQMELNATASAGNPAGKRARQDYLTPIRPGEPGKSPFWNAKSIQFMYCPSFDFPLVESAEYYRFTATTAEGSVCRFEASKPWATLTPIWMQLPVGYVTLKVEGLDAKGGEAIGVSGERRFYRAAGYNGPYHTQVMGYQESVRLALRTVFDRPYFKEWMRRVMRIREELLPPLGYLPVGICLVASGDPYFVRIDGGELVRVPHDAVQKDHIPESSIEIVCESLSTLFQCARFE